MRFSGRHFLIGVAAVVLILACAAGRSEAQVVRHVAPGMTVTTYSVPPSRYYDPFGINRRNAYLIRQYGRAYSQVPPYALGYNPYPPVYVAPLYPVPPVVTPPVYPVPGTAYPTPVYPPVVP